MIMEYHLSEDAYKEYISVTKNNANTSYELAEMKLNRNIALGRLVNSGEMVEKYFYGKLLITTCFGEIVGVYNTRKCYCNIKSKDKYKLNKLIGIS